MFRTAEREYAGETAYREPAGGESARGKAVVFFLCLVPILATIVFGGVDSWAMALLTVLISVIAVLWGVDAWRHGEFCFSADLLQLPLLGLFLIGCIQLLPLGSAQASSELLSVPASRALSLEPYATRLFLVRLAAYILYFAAALTFINGSGRVRKVAVTLIIFGSVMAFFAILQRLANPDGIYGLRPTPQAIPFGPFVNQHHFAALMEMLSGVTLGLIFCGHVKRDKKLLLAMAALVMGIAVIFTGSRGGFIGYLAVAAFVAGAAVLSGRRQIGGEAGRERPRLLLIAFGAFAALLLIGGSAAFLGGGEGLLRGIGPQASEVDVTSGRGHFWSIALQIFRDHPVIGAGLDAFGTAFPRYDTWNGIFRVEQAHNDYLQILADAGVLGFVCVAAFIYLLYLEGTSIMKRSGDGLDRGVAVGALAGCSGIIVHSFFDFPLRTPANAFFFLLLAALVVGAARSAKHHGRRRHANGR